MYIQEHASLCLLWGSMKGEKDKEVRFGMIPYNSRTVYVQAVCLPAVKSSQGMYCTFIPNRQYEADFSTGALDCLWLTN